jgi:hypothetical protein
MDRPNANQGNGHSTPGGMDRRSDAERMAEAASRPLDFQPKERAQYVRDSIALIEVYQQQGLTTEEIKEKVPTFVRDYKNLFEMVTQPGGYNKQSLKTMLAMLDKMGTGELTQHQASVIVGQRLADTYIKPSVEGKN